MGPSGPPDQTSPKDHPMAHQAKRGAAALAAVLGLALTIAGLWLAARVGPSGTATFAASPTTTGSVVLTPEVLNRVDADVTVRAEPVDGGAVFIGRSLPSDATAIVGETPRSTSAGLDASAEALRLTTTGEGETPAMSAADIWRSTVAGTGPQSIVIDQANAPESLVITSDKGKLASVTLTIANRAWFVQAVVAIVVGLALVLGGWLLWRSARSAGTAASTGSAAPAGSKAPAGPDGPAGSTTPAAEVK